MYHLNYSFSASDIKAVTAALSVLTEYDFVTDAEIDMLSSLAMSLIAKLNFSGRLDQMSNRESYVIALAIDSAYRALKNEYELDEESKAELRDYIFTYNKLEPLFFPTIGKCKMNFKLWYCAVAKPSDVFSGFFRVFLLAFLLFFLFFHMCSPFKII